MDRLSQNGFRLTRRRFLQVVGITGLGAAASAILRFPPLQRVGAIGTRRRSWAYWSDPDTWGKRIPGENDLVVVAKRIVLDVDAAVRGVVIKPRGKLIFHPRRNIILRSRENVVVRGRLSMRPRSPRVVHRLLFPEIDENRFVGGGMRVLRSDVGLWVIEHGVIDVAGSPKLAWTRATGGVKAGETSLFLDHEPIGWRVGDEVVITPTLRPSIPNHDVAYDIGTVATVDLSTRRVTLRSPTKFDHPTAQVAPGVALAPEVLNLTRNVMIEGAPTGRCHVWIRSSRRQRFRNASLRFTGPRRPSPNFPSFTEAVPGRYGLHFHVMEEASRGTIVDGVVIKDSGNHAFVTHQSHGVTFRNCISHNTFDDAYWWDPSPDPNTAPGPPTDDVEYDRCVASMVRSDPPWFGLRLAGFFLGARNGNVIRNCVAVGVQGNVDSSGFIWPESSGGLWTFEDCVAHNNTLNGIFVWQNNHLPHVISRFTAYHNGRSGVKQGAYVVGFQYQDSFLYGNRFAAIEEHALSLSSPLHMFSRVRCDQAGLSPHCVVTAPHLGAAEAPVLFVDTEFHGYSKAAFGFLDAASPFPNLFNIVDCGFEGNEFWLGPDIHPASRIRLQDPSHGNLTLRRLDQPGMIRPEWNASVSQG